MPIYAYRCSACGHAKDVLRKISDPLLSTCPACGAETFTKQVTAAGFQLKGSGWYVTDFRGGSNTGAPADKGDAEPAKADAAKGDAVKTEAGKTDSGKKDAAPAASPAPAANAPAPASTPAAAPAASK